MAQITRDAKLQSYFNQLGKPDTTKASGRVQAYTWFSRLDNGTKLGTRLSLIAKEVRGQMIVVAIYDPTSDTVLKFPWFDSQ